MRYISCSSCQREVSFEQAVVEGWAEGGGMYLPREIPELTLPSLLEMKHLSYPDLARSVLRLFVSVDEIPERDWGSLFEQCYDQFLDPVIDYSPLEDLTVVDLSRGPSLAFKDLGMQCLCSVLDYLLRRRDASRTILVGTSGDTGPSAMVALKDKPSMKIIVLYPLGRVSEEQEAQMLSFDACLENARCFGVEGTSDELDVPIETVFKDYEFRKTHPLGSVNSVNVLRLLAQVVHFFHIFLQEVKRSPDSSAIEVAIPSGAAGHLTAAVIAKLMGVPITRIVVGTNANDVLHRMLTQGNISREQAVQRTLASAMDITIPYNIERLLYLATKDVNVVSSTMSSLRSGVPTTLSSDTLAWFAEMGIVSARVSDEEILETMRWTHHSQRRVQDPHTAVGIAAARRLRQVHPSPLSMYCMGCANAAKFSDTLSSALGPDEAKKALQSLGSDNAHVRAMLMQTSRIQELRMRAREVFSAGEDWPSHLKSEIISLNDKND